MGFLDENGLGYLWGKVKSALVTKQDKLTGQPGQVVGFDADGAAAMDMPAQARDGSGTQLLDNAYWAILGCIINQRGVSGEITTPGYFIDRWKLVSGSVTITEGGLLLNGTIVQILEFDPGQEVTASYLTDGGTFPAEYDSGTKTFAITAEGVLIRAAKLEVGSVQTLAHQDEDGSWVLNDPPSIQYKAQELEKCRRYYIPRPGPDQLTFGAKVIASSGIMVTIPSNLRAPPTVIIDENNPPKIFSGSGWVTTYIDSVYFLNTQVVIRLRSNRESEYIKDGESYLVLNIPALSSEL